MNNGGKTTIQKIGQILREAGRCPACGKSKILYVDKWEPGRGPVYEPISEQKHCTCPGGLVEYTKAQGAR